MESAYPAILRLFNTYKDTKLEDTDGAQLEQPEITVDVN